MIPAKYSTYIKNIPQMKKTSLFLGSLFIFSLVMGQRIKLASVFGDRMVLQQGIHAPVWGWASPGTLVKVEMAGYTSMARSGLDGKWMVRMPPMDYGGPYELRILAGDTIRLKDVMVGELWLASGQSNMEWSVGMGIGTGTKEEINSANHPQIRYFTVPHKTSVLPLNDTESAEWKAVTPESVKHLSAVAYFFARELNKHKNVAVGIISSSWGATSAHAWMSSETLLQHPDYRALVKMQDRDPVKWTETVRKSLWNDAHRDSLADMCTEGIRQGVHLSGFHDEGWKSVSYPVSNEKIGIPWFWGVTWFRNHFEVEDLRGKSYNLKLYLRGKKVTLFLNGIKFADIADTETVNDVKIPRSLLKRGQNVLAIRLYEIWGIGMIGSSTTQAVIVSDKGEQISLSSEWKASGIIEPQVPGNQGYYNQYSVQFNGRIAPIIPYGIKGVIWYQGEGNASKAYQYRTLFPMLIDDWRMRWGQGYMPFLYVQLANHKEKKPLPIDDHVAELREAQTMTLRLPGTGMATAIDIGDPLDIHPRNKKDVGIRLHLAARKIAYGEDITHSGPMYSGYRIEGDIIRIGFTSVGNGLKIKDGLPLKGFSLAGSDRVFHWAEAGIAGDSVWVRSTHVKSPVAVRYAWESNPDGNLYNQEGLPAVPFRTDDFKMITQ